MRLFLPMPGVTFHAPNGINSTKHLMILMAGPDGDKQVAVTSVTTDRNTRATDNSCILMPTDHRFIKHRSYVSYVHATFMTVVPSAVGSTEDCSDLIPRSPQR